MFQTAADYNTLRSMSCLPSTKLKSNRLYDTHRWLTTLVVSRRNNRPLAGPCERYCDKIVIAHISVGLRSVFGCFGGQIQNNYRLAAIFSVGRGLGMSLCKTPTNLTRFSAFCGSTALLTRLPDLPADLTESPPNFRGASRPRIRGRTLPHFLRFTRCTNRDSMFLAPRLRFPPATGAACSA